MGCRAEVLVYGSGAVTVISAVARGASHLLSPSLTSGVSLHLWDTALSSELSRVSSLTP